MTGQGPRNGDHLETLSRGLALLAYFGAGHAELGIQEAADHLSISRGAARRFLITLADLGYLTRQGRSFRINANVLDLGYRYFASMDLPDIAQPILDELAERTGEFCGLYILNGSDIVVIGSGAGGQSMTFRPHRGTTYPAYATAAGRVIMAEMADAQLDALLATVKLESLTPYTVRTVPALRKAIMQVREDGYCVVANELAYGMAGVALPIRNAQGRCIASVNISLQRGGTPDDMVHVCLPALGEAVGQINAILEKLGYRT